MNKVILLGNVGKDPQMRFVEKRPIASFPLATTEPARRAPNGAEIPERTEWHNIVMTDKFAEFAEKYIRKGRRMLVEGTLRTRYWEDRNTIKHTITEIYVISFEML
ncbi:MAG: single-stranded DNA-binding protein [Muribaculaceae bacterium]